VTKLVGHDPRIALSVRVVEPLHVAVEEDRVLEDLVAVDVHVLRQGDAQMAV
jgi:hypothetical protein